MIKVKQVVVLLLAVCVLSACGPRMEPAPKVLEGRIFGTFFQVSIGTQHEFDEDEIKTGVLTVLNEVDRQMSTYRDDSVLNRVNRAPLGEPVTVPPELFYVLELGYEIAELSGGAFDFTVGGLVNLWGFGPEGRVTTAPDDDVLQQRLQEVGYRYVSLDAANQTVTRHADVFIDLSGIAKGYGVDAVSEYLLTKGIDNHLVNIGGDLKGNGMRSEERAWHVGIEAPNDAQQIIRHIMPIYNLGMVGSGDYRNYFEEDGVRYSHTIDPTTGRPIAHRLAGVHVIGENTTEIDALATVFMVLGEEVGLQFANEHDIAAIFLYRTNGNFDAVMSDRFERNHADAMSIPEVR
ncbi:FAD:protein FMN transferase [Aliidiomarina halalkaliphila]|uniref:FAD:protein FMN transferase n=1 Tax=Aliidiomarina halalkaliphila TaxID=2593535 RepID=A0A552X0T3_9GAMM|nr:FAD:protein FMN transferase [Aliidiomarina halalkaliphila]TRW48660.1 FAD:protein FMN transferase [Aliidiomarina halalkaliphila]